MFNVRTSTVILAIVASVIAAPGGTAGTTLNQCNTGGIQCCANNISASQAPASIASVLGSIPLQGLIGMNCNPIVAGSGASCQQQPVCCTNFQNDGPQVIGVNCSPVNINA